ncbi:type II methionyl aminopeptidase [Candidatus Micrarchaeota archaeon]|nr:MAG: type II methionyl aminopeptidase [Candidatus Micrarchaeota archaeon]
MDDLEKFKRAGKIAAEVREESMKLIRIGEKALDVANMIERWILEKGGSIAFPVNISVNNQAAHATPSYNDEYVFGEKDLVTIDIGVHVDGFVGGDTAYSVDLSGERQILTETSKKALENALSKVKAGVEIGEIGKEIEETARQASLRPVENLTGHGLARWQVHTLPSIPNIGNKDKTKLKEGQIIAIEPFISNGSGRVREGVRTEIFSFEGKVLTRNRDARKLLDIIYENYKTLPFAERWLYDYMPELKLKLALRDLAMRGAIRGYPILKDVEGSFVSQHEVSLIVEKDSCTLLTPMKF